MCFPWSCHVVKNRALLRWWRSGWGGPWQWRSLFAHLDLSPLLKTVMTQVFFKYLCRYHSFQLSSRTLLFSGEKRFLNLHHELKGAFRKCVHFPINFMCSNWIFPWLYQHLSDLFPFLHSSSTHFTLISRMEPSVSIEVVVSPLPRLDEVPPKEARVAAERLEAARDPWNKKYTS